ncbi:hypothetical protein MPTK1_5g23080 [Marchantia polymorpha subsp. ruderalis]|uniref:Rubisco LSMT substrate-binding domain-containing protein n=2 Tax=Marchantia polymorpha TaxID=3197 RepID=A0AAF6BLC8_MARPO|nr:hypothetical protein MARPO_0010s0148 [Marchantia polymorpha]BBN12812.1 hypothetical protein Mp_5g23080 [Marchantia polymorpha subsp. ruderalis]|eukprot:PTQ46766.1 hypothetical protein MARPO_0010s0148 [Marchantia polymorpha]
MVTCSCCQTNKSCRSYGRQRKLTSFLLGPSCIRQVIKEDRLLIEEDWMESIVPLTESNPAEFPAEWFTLDRFLAAKALVSSRAFEVDEYHGYGMVPLADLFNHKTADEDVHFTSVDSDMESEADDAESEVEELPHVESLQKGKMQAQGTNLEARKSTERKGSRYLDIEGRQLDVDMKQEGSVKTRRSSRRINRSLEENDQTLLVHEADESTTLEVGRKRRKKQAQIVKDEADIGTVEKPLRKANRKGKDPHSTVEEYESTIDAKDIKIVEAGDRRRGTHRKKMDLEVQEASEAQQIARKRDKKTKVEEKHVKSESDCKVSQNSRSRSKLKHVNVHQNDVHSEENYSIKRQEIEEERSGKKKKTKAGTEVVNEVEVSSEVSSQAWEGTSELLEMILVKDVAGGSEVFNTYGTLSNAGLLHRYGFTELNNPFDIVNIDLSFVVDSLKKAFTSRHIRRRLTNWRKVGCAPLVSQDDEYFEITATGRPQEEFIMLLYMVHLSEDAFETLSNASAGCDSVNWVESASIAAACFDSDNWIEATAKILECRGPSKDLPVAKRNKKAKQGRKQELVNKVKQEVDSEARLLSTSVCNTMLEALRSRDGLYPSDSIEDDEIILSESDSSQEPQKFHALRLRISERSILKLCESNVLKQLNLLKQSNI